MDVTTATVSISRGEFLQNLAASRLLSDAELQKLPPGEPGEEALSLAHALVAAGTLTPYQADRICQGHQAELRAGNYDILDRLGAGGMGTVFKARHRRMKRLVALKVLAADLGKDAGFVKRFQREVEVVARLGHPNVVLAYDADEAELGHFLVMEFVNGRDLASLVEKTGPLDVAQAIDCTLQAARGLAYAHAQGIVHRDVKPHNLLRDEAGTVKVTDLGLARLSTPGAGSASGLTQAGGILGTVDYMPPEQAADSTTTDHRADIYSLGCTLFFLLTGRPPYDGPSMMSILLKHRDAPVPSLAAARPDVPPVLDAIYHRMLAKSAADRYQTMAEVVAALEGVAAQVGGAAGPAPVVPGPAAATSSTVCPAGTAATGVLPPADILTVLVVEPSRVQAGIIRKYLEAQDVRVTAAATGKDALAAVSSHRPDVVVTALHLADMTGTDLVNRVQAAAGPDAPGFVVVSSAEEGKEVGTLSKLRRVVLLHKPFTPEQLVAALNVVTGKGLALKSTAVSVAPLAALARPTVDRAALRVLVVDDSAVARTIVCSTLRGLGFAQFVEVADGAHAITAAARESFALIVTDFHMPLLSGHALVSYLKQTPATANIPVLMVTTETDPNLLDPVRKLGVAAVFEKAFPAAAVKPVIDQLF
jgi:CheY-like chemotaxis protein/tRNA A-37 threonylcarbamoyl transferase component Bud32